MNNQNYERLGIQLGDIINSNVVEYKSQDKWILTNILPTKLELWTRKEFDSKTLFLTLINPRETLTFSPNKITNNEELYVYYRYEGKLILFTESFTMRTLWKNIKIGAVTHSSTSGHGEVQVSNADISGIWIHNRMTFPIDIYYKNNLVAQIFGYTGLEYMGGGASSIYFDNDREGLNIMDQISFRYSLPGSQGKYLFTVTIDDQHCNEMFVGVVSGGDLGSNRDNSVYNVDKPNYTGITYYEQIGDYKSAPY
jgi:hypothetical protein